MKVKLRDGKTVKLSSVPLGKGGEGNVHSVEQGQGGRSSLVAKLYKPEKRTSHQEQKIDFLIANSPNCESNGHTYLIWPKEALTQNGEFAGFLMPKAHGVELEKLCLAKLDDTLGPQWQRFGHGASEAKRLRLSLCRNISHAVAAVQQKRCYVLVDLKPVNIFVNPQGLVSIIDLDSLQVTERGHLLYGNKVCTPEYTPPEAAKKEKIRKSSWDDFTLAVILYRVLVGIHPFTGSYKDSSITEVSAGIKLGLYPHGPKKSSFRVIPPLHQRLNEYPDSVAKLFNRCFVEGTLNPDLRPSAKEWFDILHDLLSAPPVINSFTSSSDIVTNNSPILLKWEVRNAVSIKISGIGDVTNLTQLDVKVKQDSAYILQATSFTGKKVEKSIIVKTDKRPPEIKTFGANRLVISVGDSVTLHWNVIRAETVALTPGRGKLSPSDRVTVKPNSSTKFKLTALSCFGIESYQFVDVIVHPLPEIQEFTLSHSKVKPGKTATLSWRCKSYQRIELFDGASFLDVTGLSSLQIKPTADTEYKLRVSGYDLLQEKIATVSIQVLHDAKIDEFTANRLVTIQTVSAVLRWKVRHAKSLVLEPGGLDVTGTTSLEVSPNVSTTYELIAKHELHETRKSIKIDVTPLPKIDKLHIPQPPRLKLNPPSKVWPLLPELLSGISDMDGINEVLKTQVLPGNSPFTGPVSRLLHHIRHLMHKAK